MAKDTQLSLSDLCDIVETARFIDTNVDLSSPANMRISLEKTLQDASKCHKLFTVFNKLTGSASTLGNTQIAKLQFSK